MAIESFGNSCWLWFYNLMIMTLRGLNSGLELTGWIGHMLSSHFFLPFCAEPCLLREWMLIPALRSWLLISWSAKRRRTSQRGCQTRPKMLLIRIVLRALQSLRRMWLQGHPRARNLIRGDRKGWLKEPGISWSNVAWIAMGWPMMKPGRPSKGSTKKRETWLLPGLWVWAPRLQPEFKAMPWRTWARWSLMRSFRFFWNRRGTSRLTQDSKLISKTWKWSTKPPSRWGPIPGGRCPRFASFVANGTMEVTVAPLSTSREPRKRHCWTMSWERVKAGDGSVPQAT